MRTRCIFLMAITLSGLSACSTHKPAAKTPTAPPSMSASNPQPSPHATTTQATSEPTHTPLTQPIVTAPIPMIAATQPGPVDDRVAYAIGYSAGRRIHDRLAEDGRTANDWAVMRGLVDGLSDHNPDFPQADVLEAFAEFQSYTQQRRAEKLYADNPAFRKHADENQQKSRALLDQNAEMAGVEVRPDGAQVRVLNAGTGRLVGNAKSIGVKNLRVSLVDGTLVTQTDGDKPETLAVTDLLPALADQIRGMRFGTKCRVWLPPDKAYGLAGRAPVIGPNQAIQYEFELINAE